MSSDLSAVELLNLGDAGRVPPLLTRYWPETVGTVFGVCMGIFINFQTRRPAFSGIQKHILFAAGFTGALTFVQKRRNAYLAEKDAVLRHYIELHPEDFPEPPEPRKIADLLEPWIPIR